jgi:hypothetical protein
VTDESALDKAGFDKAELATRGKSWARVVLVAAREDRMSFS